MIAYNHAAFIAQAIEGVMQQQTSFDVELVIGEDCSTDNTRVIIQDYQRQFPEKIKLLLPEKNLGMMANFSQTLQACTGTYVALCEGDDYWTDPHKLQKQVNLLEENPSFSISFHRVKVIHENNPALDYISNPDQQEETTILDLALNNYIHTVSCVFRNHQTVLPASFHASPVGDYLLHLLNAQHGKIHFLPATMAVYRVHAGGVWGEKNRAEQFTKWDIVLQLAMAHFQGKVKKTLIKQRKNNLRELNKLYKKLNQPNPLRWRFYWIYFINFLNKIN